MCGTAEASTESDGYTLDAESKEPREHAVNVKFSRKFEKGTTPQVFLMHRRLHVGVVDGESYMDFGAVARDVTHAGFKLVVTAGPGTRMASFAVDWLAHPPPAEPSAAGAGAGAGAGADDGPDGVPLPELMQVFKEPLSFEVRGVERTCMQAAAPPVTRQAVWCVVRRCVWRLQLPTEAPKPVSLEDQARKALQGISWMPRKEADAAMELLRTMVARGRASVGDKGVVGGTRANDLASEMMREQEREQSVEITQEQVTEKVRPSHAARTGELARLTCCPPPTHTYHARATERRKPSNCGRRVGGVHKQAGR